MKTKISLLSLMTMLLIGCATINDPYIKQLEQKELETKEKEIYQKYLEEQNNKTETIEETEEEKENRQTYQELEKFYLKYQEKDLVSLIDIMLKKNFNYNKEKLTLNKIYFLAEKNVNIDENKLNLIVDKEKEYKNIDLNRQQLNANGSIGAEQSKKLNEGNNETYRYSSGINLSYSLDLLNKIDNLAKKEEFSLLANEYQTRALKNTLIKEMVNQYLQLAYYNEMIELNEKAIGNYEKLLKIQQSKYQQKIIDALTVEQVKQQLIEFKQQKEVNQWQKDNVLLVIKNLINEEKIPTNLLKNIDKKTLKQINFLNMDLNDYVRNQISFLQYKNNVKEAEMKLKSMIENYKSNVKSFYPNLTINSALSFSSNEVKNLYSTPLLTNSIVLDLPFLNYEKIKMDVKASESDYNIALLEFENALKSSLNQIDFAIKKQKSMNNIYAMQLQKNKKSKMIKNYYKKRYEMGINEFSDYLKASNDNIATEKDLSMKKLDIFKSQIETIQSLL